MALDPDSSKGRSRTTPRRNRRRPLQEQRFSSYLTFGFQATACLAVFLIIYILVLLGISPLLSEEAPQQSNIGKGQVLKPVVDPLVEKIKSIPRVPGELIAEEVGTVIKKRIHNFRQKEGMTDASLMKRASEEINNLRKRRHPDDEQVTVEGEIVAAQAAPGKRAGFVVLGMHRSGTSMLSGLLVTGNGYNVGGPLIGGAFDNEKGFFERIDAVLQNDEFMKHQQSWWAGNVKNYKAEVALEQKKNGLIEFNHGEKALKFLNNPEKAPWLQKDPRMCITLQTWLPLLNNEPAVLFTYRHPLEVALSLKKREKNFPLEKGLRLWIVYNMRAIQNSAKLCRVLTSNDAVLADPLKEVQRIADELTSTCGVPAAPRKLTQDDVDRFIDANLQHNKKKVDDSNNPVIAEYDGCEVRDYETSTEKGTGSYERERGLYLKAMKIYCDFQSGAAYKEGYEWPEL